MTGHETSVKERPEKISARSGRQCWTVGVRHFAPVYTAARRTRTQDSASVIDTERTDRRDQRVNATPAAPPDREHR